MAEFVILRSLDVLSTPIETAPLGPGIASDGPTSGLGNVPEITVETADLTANDVRNAQRDPAVLGVARAMPIKLIEPVAAADGVPTWGVTAVGADTSPFTGAGVTVAVLDTGADAGHAAFHGMSLNQRDFSGSGNQDANGHGTHCAGTIFGRDVDGTRIGVAQGVTNALIGKVLDDSGSGSSIWLFDAMNWAVENGAHVISMSLGFDFPGFSARLIEEEGLPPILATSIALEGYRMNLRVFDRLMASYKARAAFTGGTVVCAASGNESERQIHANFEVSASVPAAADGVISVGALQQSGAGLSVADFSNTNPTLSAPGVGVVSAATGGGLTTLSGTSMACPHVAGLAALWWEALPSLSLPQSQGSVEARLLATAQTDGFAAGVQIADRGQGLARAPMGAGN